VEPKPLFSDGLRFVHCLYGLSDPGVGWHFVWGCIDMDGGWFLCLDVNLILHRRVCFIMNMGHADFPSLLIVHTSFELVGTD